MATFNQGKSVFHLYLARLTTRVLPNGLEIKKGPIDIVALWFQILKGTDKSTPGESFVSGVERAEGGG